MKIGILTYFFASNYGAALQAWALAQLLREAGAQAELINYRCPALARPYALDQIAAKGAGGYLLGVAGHLARLPRRGKFSSFVETMPLSPSVTRRELPQLGREYDAFLTGSDQVWNCQVNGGDPTYLLDFVPPGVARLSFSASFGFSHLPPGQEEFYRRHLQKFENLSVREESGAKIIGQLLGRRAQVTLDPTLLLPGEAWEALAAGEPADRAPYILVYQLGFSSAMLDFARQLREKTGYPIQVVSLPLGRPLRARWRMDAGPAQWLRLIRDAEFVVTDSFHGTVFSILFHKRFFTETGGSIQKTSGRIGHLLSTLGLEGRILSPGQLDSFSREIDYSGVERRLEREREASLRYLKKIAGLTQGGESS